MNLFRRTGSSLLLVLALCASCFFSEYFAFGSYPSSLKLLLANPLLLLPRESRLSSLLPNLLLGRCAPLLSENRLLVLRLGASSSKSLSASKSSL